MFGWLSFLDLPPAKADCGRPVPNHQVGTPKSHSRGLHNCDNASESSDMRESPMTQGRAGDETALQVASMLPFAMPPKDVVAEGITLYFQYCHKQPLWLFDPDDLVIPEKCRSEVVFGILSLALRYSSNPFPEGRTDQICRQYAEAARSYAMFRVAQGTVNLSTIQSLCLIALAEYIGEI
jgi:hypothetical protein